MNKVKSIQMLPKTLKKFGVQRDEVLGYYGRVPAFMVMEFRNY